jgi:hypothetical protein
MDFNKIKDFDLPEGYGLEIKDDHFIYLKYQNDVIAVYNYTASLRNIRQEIKAHHNCLEMAKDAPELEDF